MLLHSSCLGQPLGLRGRQIALLGSLRQQQRCTRQPWHAAVPRAVQSTGGRSEDIPLTMLRYAPRPEGTQPPPPRTGSGKCPVTRLGQVLSVLAITGATTGTFLDSIHTKVAVLHYDVLPIDVGTLHTSVLVPPLLSMFYVVLGSLVIWGDYALGGDEATEQALCRSNSLLNLVASFGALAAMLELSSVLYTNGASYDTICVVLATLAAVNYLLFDGTKQGLGLALLCAIGAPAIELLLMQSLGLWHYPQGNMLADVAGGIPSWVPWCYFAYVPAVANLSRFLSRNLDLSRFLAPANQR